MEFHINFFIRKFFALILIGVMHPYQPNAGKAEHFSFGLENQKGAEISDTIDRHYLVTRHNITIT